MSAAPRPARSARLPGAVLAGVAAVGVLSGCQGDSPDPDRASSSSDSSSSAASSSAASPSSAGTSGSPELTAALLPAEAFGPGANVAPVPPAQLEQGSLLSAQEGLQITPEGCAAAVEGTQPQIGEFDEVAAESATLGATATVEVLLRGGPTGDAVAGLTDAVADCPQGQISSPEVGEATFTFESIPVEDLGDGAAAVVLTITQTQADGRQLSFPTLVGVAQDGDRLISLLSLNQDGSAPDTTAFAALLQRAYETQASALG